MSEAIGIVRGVVERFVVVVGKESRWAEYLGVAKLDGFTGV